MLEVSGVGSWAEKVEPSSGALGRPGISRQLQMICVSSLQILLMKLAGRKLGQAGNWCEWLKSSWVYPQRGALPIWETHFINDGPCPLLFQQLQSFTGIEKSAVLSYLDINLFLKFPASFPVSSHPLLTNLHLRSWLYLLSGNLPSSCNPSFCKRSCLGSKDFWVFFYGVMKGLVSLEWVLVNVSEPES